MSRPVCVQRTGRRTEMSYKAESLGKAAQHVKALDSGDTVNGAAVQRKSMSLSGETCLSCGIDYCSVRLPAGATGTQRSRLLQERAFAWRGDTNPREADRPGIFPAPYRATWVVRRQESAEAIVGEGSCHRRRGSWKRALTNRDGLTPPKGQTRRKEKRIHEL